MIKKSFAVVFIVLSLLLSGCASGKGGAVSFEEPLVLDKAAKKGVLDNGMTYFVYKNSEPKNRITMRLAVKVGSVMESDSERGVAHFIEHMAFNGTENFNKNEIISWFEKIGMSFGDGLNAYTSFEETVYNLDIPADDPELLKTAMLVMKDWASGMTFPQEELDKERGVVVEEWRTRNLGLQGRLMEALIPFLLKDSIFQNRLPIGKPDIIKTISRDEVVSFYKNWYRPELMSIIVVGDADENEMEKVMRETMSLIPARTETVSVPTYKLALEVEKDFLEFRDPEQKYALINIFAQNNEANINTTVSDMKKQTVQQMAYEILNRRLSEITNSTEAPWLVAELGRNQFNNFNDFGFLGFVPKEGQYEIALKMLFDEVDRFIAFGPSETEVERIKNEYTGNNKKELANKDKVTSENIAVSLVSNYLTGFVKQSVEDYCKNFMNVLNTITASELQDFIREEFGNRGEKYFSSLPLEYPDSLSEETILDIWKNYENSDIQVYSDEVVDGIVQRPAKKAKIVSRSENKSLGSKEFILENGIRVITRKTDFKKDEILFRASSAGGSFQIKDEDLPSLIGSPDFLILSGFNGISYNQFVKFMSDKGISLSFGINNVDENISGNSNNDDLEYLFQLLYVGFEKRQYTEDAWKILQDNLIVSAKSHGLQPNDVFVDKIKEMLFGKDDLNHKSLDMDLYNKRNMESAKRIMEERFKNPADFTFTFVGDFDEKQLLDFCCYYLGNMKTTQEKEKTVYKYWQFPEGINHEVVNKGQDDKGILYACFGGELPPAESMEEGFKEGFIYSQLKNLLEICLREEIREEKGGSYGIGVYSDLQGEPDRYYTMEISFGCEPDRQDELLDSLIKTIRGLKENGVSEENVLKLREAFRRDREINKRNNYWWMNKINSIQVFSYEPEWIIENEDAIISLITAENLHAAAKKYLNTEKYISLFLKPENK